MSGEIIAFPSAPPPPTVVVALRRLAALCERSGELIALVGDLSATARPAAMSAIADVQARVLLDEVEAADEHVLAVICEVRALMRPAPGDGGAP